MAPPPRDRRGAPSGSGGRSGGGRLSAARSGGAKKAGGFGRGRGADPAGDRSRRTEGSPKRDRDDRPKRDERAPRNSGDSRGGDKRRVGAAGGRDRRDDKGVDWDPRPQPSPKAPKKWGALARKGTRWLEGDEGSASGAWRKAVDDARESERLARPVERAEPDVWIREDEDDDDAPVAPPPARAKSRRAKLPDEVAAEISGKVDAKQRERDLQRLSDAIRAYDRDRYQDALRMLKVIIEHAPDVAAARELLGLTLYRLGRWPAAVKELRAYFELTGSYDQHPTLMDAYRAQKRWPTVEKLWNELKGASPHPAVIAEGRIVMAGALADRGDIRKAIDLLERARPVVKNPKDHHLRTMYALADLYDRAGDIPRARDLFGRLAEIDPDYFDVRSRLRSL